MGSIRQISFEICLSLCIRVQSTSIIKKPAENIFYLKERFIVLVKSTKRTNIFFLTGFVGDQLTLTTILLVDKILV